METVVEHVRVDLSGKVGSAGVQIGIGVRLGPRDELAGVGTDEAALPASVLHRGDGAAVPDRLHVARDAAVIAELSVEIRKAFPGDHRRQMRGAQRGDLPLIDGVVADAEQADFSGAPRLGARPLDAVAQVDDLAGAPRIDVAR